MLTQDEFKDKLKALLDEAGVDLVPRMNFSLEAVPRLQSNPPSYVPSASAVPQPSEPAPVDPVVPPPVAAPELGPEANSVNEPAPLPSQDAGVPAASPPSAGDGEAVA